VLRDFVRDSAIYGVATIVQRSAQLMLVPLYTRVLDPAEYGLVELFLVLSALVNLTVALEVSQGFARYYADAPSRAARVSYASTALWFSLLMYSLFVVVGLVMADSTRLAVGSATDVGTVRLAVLAMGTSGMLLQVLGQLRWAQRARDYAGVAVVYTSLTVLAAVWLVARLELGVTGVIAGQLTGSVAGLLLALVLLRGDIALTADWARLRQMLTFSIPLVPSSLGVYLSLYADRVLIGRILGLASLGIYGVGYRVASVVMLPMFAVQAALTPLVYGRYRMAQTAADVSRIFRNFSALALVMMVALSIFAPEIIGLAAAPEYEDAASVVPFLAPALLLSNMYVFAPGLALANRTGRIALLNLGGAVLVVTLDLALIPPFGIVGAGAANLITALSVFLGYVVMGQREYPIPHDWRRLLAAAAGGILAVVLGALVSAPQPQLLVAKAVLVLAVALWAMWLGLFEPRALLTWLNGPRGRPGSSGRGS
jgi:O-antigen/teichoic acid export membrane protein